MYPLTIWPIPPQPPPLPIWTPPLYCLVLLLSWVSTLLSIPLTPPLVSWTPTLLERNITKLPVVSKRSCRTTNPFKISLLFWVSKGFSFTYYNFGLLKYISATFWKFELIECPIFLTIFNYCMYWSCCYKKETLFSLNFVHSSRYVLSYKGCVLRILNKVYDFPVKANMVCLQTLLCFPFYFSKWRGTLYKLFFFENYSLVVHFANFSM